MLISTFLVSWHSLLTKQMACRLSSRRIPVSTHQALLSAPVRNFSKEHNPNEDEAHKEGVTYYCRCRRLCCTVTTGSQITCPIPHIM